MSTGEKVVKRICPQCGRVLEEEWRSCPFCGKNLTVTTETATTVRTGYAGITSIVLGAISLIIAGIPLGIAAVVLGAYALTKEDNKGIGGLILGVLGILLAILVLWLGLWPF